MHTDALKSSKFVIEINTHTVTTIGRAGISWHAGMLRNKAAAWWPEGRGRTTSCPSCLSVLPTANR